MKHLIIKIVGVLFIVGLGLPIFLPILYILYPIIKDFVMKNTNEFFALNLFMAACLLIPELFRE